MSFVAVAMASARRRSLRRDRHRRRAGDDLRVPARRRAVQPRAGRGRGDARRGPGAVHVRGLGVLAGGRRAGRLLPGRRGGARAARARRGRRDDADRLRARRCARCSGAAKNAAEGGGDRAACASRYSRCVGAAGRDLRRAPPRRRPQATGGRRAPGSRAGAGCSRRVLGACAGGGVLATAPAAAMPALAVAAIGALRALAEELVLAASCSVPSRRSVATGPGALARGSAPRPSAPRWARRRRCGAHGWRVRVRRRCAVVASHGGGRGRLRVTGRVAPRRGARRLVVGVAAFA